MPDTRIERNYNPVRRIRTRHQTDVYYFLERRHSPIIRKIVGRAVAIGAGGAALAGIIYALSQIGFGAETGLPRPSSPRTPGIPGNSGNTTPGGVC